MHGDTRWPVRQTLLAGTLALLVGGCADEERSYADPAEPYRRTLEELVVYQTEYIREHGEPATRPLKGFEPVESYVALAVNRTPSGEWGATTFDMRDPAWSCVYKSEFVTSFVETRGGAEAAPGEVVCDEGGPKYLKGTADDRYQAALDRGQDWPERRQMGRLLQHQNDFHARNGRYATDEDLRTSGFQLAEDVSRFIFDASADGLSMVTSGKAGSCMYWTGTGQPLMVDATPEMADQIQCIED